MNRTYIISLMLTGLLCGACQSSNKNQTAEAEKQENILTESNIPYTVAEGYFQNNNVKQLPVAPITSQEEFDTMFGCAAVMGENGRPTPIDFSKSYVIAVSKPETEYPTELIPTSLKKDAQGNIVFTYRVVKDSQKRSYKMIPCTIIIVDNAHSGKIILNEAD